MDQTILRKQRELTDRLNRYRNEYYNHNKPSVSDEVYDRLFDELQSLEKETGVQMANSPTTTVGYPVVGKLEKATHEIPLLSLDKVKSSLDLCRFMGEHQVMMNIQKPAVADNQTVNQDTPFAGKTIVVTGKVEPYTRDEMNSLIASLGAVAGSSVSRKTDYLVCGEKAGSKLSKAQELGIRVLTSNEFFNMAGVA